MTGKNLQKRKVAILSFFVVLAIIALSAQLANADQVPQNPVVVFTADQYSVTSGAIALIKADVLSSDNAVANYGLELISPSDLQYWVWFDGHRYDTLRNNIAMEFRPLEKKTVFIGVFGGRPGIFELRLRATSKITGKDYLSSATIKVVDQQTAIFTPTPEGKFLVPLVLLGALVLVVFGENNKGRVKRKR